MDINQIIARHLAGESSQEEEQQLLAWLAEDKTHQENFEQIKAFWSEESNDMLFAKSEIWKKLAVEIKEENQFQVNKPIVKIGRITIYRVAAALLLLALCYIGFEQIDFSNSNKTNGVDEVVAVEMLTRENPSGKKSTLKLPDGTVIKLNSESKISFPAKFTAERREITLIGEAFLSVKHDPNRPFIIKTGDLETKVLGTSFNISAYPGQPVQKVALLEGKVEVYDAKKDMKVSLEPGEMVSTEQAGMTKSGFDYDVEFGWKDGKLVFDNVNNEALIFQLERWFGYQIILERPISGNSYTSTFINESLEDVLTVIGDTKGFTFSILTKEKRVIIR